MEAGMMHARKDAAFQSVEDVTAAYDLRRLSLFGTNGQTQSFNGDGII